MVHHSHPHHPISPPEKDNLWQKVVTAQSGACQVVVEDIADTLESLSHLFGEGTPGWRVGLLNLPGFNSANWQDAHKRMELDQKMAELMHIDHNSILCLLHTPQVLLFARMEGLVQIESVAVHLADFLNPKKPNEVRYFDLGHRNLEFAHLCEKWAADNRAQQLEKLKISTELTPEQQTTFRLTKVQMQMRRDRRLLQVLVVEDDPSTSLLLAQLMNQHHLVATAYDAVEAVREYRKTVPDMVLLDIGLPDISGLELLRKMIAADPHAYVVMLTANAFKANLDKALESGAKGFMAKPFNREKLNSYIQTALQLKRQREK